MIENSLTLSFFQLYKSDLMDFIVSYMVLGLKVICLILNCFAENPSSRNGYTSMDRVGVQNKIVLSQSQPEMECGNISKQGLKLSFLYLYILLIISLFMLPKNMKTPLVILSHLQTVN